MARDGTTSPSGFTIPFTYGHRGNCTIFIRTFTLVLVQGWFVFNKGKRAKWPMTLVFRIRLEKFVQPIHLAPSFKKENPFCSKEVHRQDCSGSMYTFNRIDQRLQRCEPESMPVAN